jgi:hypothetical protein
VFKGFLADPRLIVVSESFPMGSIFGMHPPNLRMISFARLRGSSPYATLAGSPDSHIFISGPGHTKRLASVSTTQQRSSSRPRRCLVKCGISTANASLGVLIGRAARQPLETFLHERLFEPLVLCQTSNLE